MGKLHTQVFWASARRKDVGAFRTPGSSTALPIAEVMSIYVYGPCPRSESVHNRGSSCAGTSMYTPVSTAEVHAEHKKAKAAALKLTPRKSFRKVAPEFSVRVRARSRHDRSAGNRTSDHLGQLPGDTDRKKSLAEYDVGKQVKIYLFVEVQQIISGIRHLSDIYPYYYWGR